MRYIIIPLAIILYIWWTYTVLRDLQLKIDSTKLRQKDVKIANN